MEFQTRITFSICIIIFCILRFSYSNEKFHKLTTLNINDFIQQHQDKNIIIVFVVPNCILSNSIEGIIIETKSKIILENKSLENKVVLAKVNYMIEKEIISYYNISTYPSILVINSEYSFIKNIVANKGINSLSKQIENLLNFNILTENETDSIQLDYLTFCNIEIENFNLKDIKSINKLAVKFGLSMRKVKNEQNIKKYCDPNHSSLVISNDINNTKFQFKFNNGKYNSDSLYVENNIEGKDEKNIENDNYDGNSELNRTSLDSKIYISTVDKLMMKFFFHNFSYPYIRIINWEDFSTKYNSYLNSKHSVSSIGIIVINDFNSESPVIKQINEIYQKFSNQYFLNNYNQFQSIKNGSILLENSKENLNDLNQNLEKIVNIEFYRGDLKSDISKFFIRKLKKMKSINDLTKDNYIFAYRFKNGKLLSYIYSEQDHIKYNFFNMNSLIGFISSIDQDFSSKFLIYNDSHITKNISDNSNIKIYNFGDLKFLLNQSIGYYDFIYAYRINYNEMVRFL